MRLSLGSPLLFVIALGCAKDAPVEGLPGAQDGPVQEQVDEAAPAPDAALAPAAEPAGSSLLSPDQQALVARIRVEGNVLTLIDAGAEPRQALVVTAGAGHTERVRFGMDMTMAMSMGAMGMNEARMPTIISDMVMEVLEVTPEDHLVVSTETVSVTLDASDPSIDPMLAQQLEGSLEGMVGMRVLSTMDRLGHTLDTEMELPEGMDPAMRDQIDSMSNSLSQVTALYPSEPVGPGARWDTAMLVENQGMSLLQIVSYQLDALEAHTATLSYEYEQVLVGMSTMEGLPPGAGVEFSSFESGGHGQSVHELTDLTPQQVHADLAMDFLMRITVQDMTQDMRTTMDIGLDLNHVEE